MGDQFAAAVRQFRLRAGLTQEALADRSGISVSTIRGMETGTRRNPQLASVRRLATALDLQQSELDELLAAATGIPDRAAARSLADPTAARGVTEPAAASGAADPAVATGVAGPGAAPTVPRQLPVAPAPFVGRRHELDLLDAALRQDRPGSGVVICTLVGTAGVGKSWLAVHWAHRNADRFPDGQLFVDLQGFSPTSEPMEPAVALRGFLDALGVESERIPLAPHAQAALFRSLVADKRMLIVLDNAADTAQVTPLLPGAGMSSVLVTSRNQLSGLLTGQGAHHLSVDILTDTQAHALLAARLGPERLQTESAAELVSLCGGFPLALSIIAGRAHLDPQLSLADLADELRRDALDVLDDADPAASLPAALSSSHHALTDEEAEVFVLLAIAPGPDISLAAASSLTGHGRSRTRSILRRLEQASLIGRDAAGRYRMHDLVRRYAAGAHDLDDDARAAALRRVLDHYTHTAYAGARLLDTHRPPIDLAPPVPGCHPEEMPDIPAAMDWFDAEHANLLAAQHTAAAEGLHRTVWQLAWTMNDFHYRRGHRGHQLAVWQNAVDSAARLPDPGAQILAYRLLGRAHVMLGDHPAAIDALNKALALSEQQGDRAMQAQAHYTLASVWSDDRKALEHAEHALDLYRGLDDPVKEADALNAVGWFELRLGDYVPAREHCQAALALYRQHHDVNGEAQTLDSLGLIDHHTGDHRAAVQYFLDALSIYRDLDNTFEIADTLDRLGQTYAAAGSIDRAHGVWREALELYRQQGRDKEAEEVERRLGGTGHR